MTDELRIISTSEELDVISDMFRLRIIHVYRDHKGPLTVKGCADILGEVSSKVHYHVKKLLKVNFLELDHIEVINGINAKYYKLTARQFEVRLVDQDEKTLEKSLHKLTTLTVSIIENFKMDFITTSQNAIANDIKDETDVGWVSSSHIYLSEEEYMEFKTLLTKFILDRSEYSAEKKKYSYISGISHKK